MSGQAMIVGLFALTIGYMLGDISGWRRGYRLGMLVGQLGIDDPIHKEAPHA